MTALYISRRWYMAADIIDVIIGSDERELAGAPLVKLIYFNQSSKVAMKGRQAYIYANECFVDESSFWRAK